MACLDLVYTISSKLRFCLYVKRKKLEEYFSLLDVSNQKYLRFNLNAEVFDITAMPVRSI